MKNRKPHLIEPIGHTLPIMAVAISPKGDFILTGSVDGTAKLWSSQGKEIYTLEGHHAGVNAVAFSPKKSQIITGSYDKYTILWDIETGEELFRFKRKENAQDIHSLAFSPDGKKILVGGKEGHVTLWTIPPNKTAAPSHTFFDYHKDTVGGVAFSPNNKIIATCSADKETFLIDLKKPKEKITIKHEDKVKSVAFSPNSAQVVTASTDGKVNLWKVKDGTLIQELKGHEKAVNSVAFSEDAKIVSGSTDKSVIIWERKSWRHSYKKKHTLNGHEKTVHSVAFSPDGDYVVSGSDEKMSILWNANTGKKVVELKGHSKAIFDASFSPDGLEVLAGTSKPFAFLWDLKEGKIRPNLLMHEVDEERSQVLRSVTYSDDGSLMLTGSTDKFAVLWDAKTKERIEEEFKHSTAIHSVAISRDNSFLVCGTKSKSKNLFLWDRKKKTGPIEFKGHKNEVRSVAISPDQKYILSGSVDKKVILWNRKTKAKLKELTDHTGTVRKVVFSPDGKHFLTGSSDNSAILWNTRSRKKKAVLEGHKSDIYDLAFSSDGTRILSGSKDNKAILWDLKGKELQRYEGHKSTVSSVHFSPSSEYVLTGSHDCTLKLWNTESGQEIASLIGVGKNDWVVTAPNGLFDASPGAMKLMHYAVGLELIELDQLKERYWRPGLLKAMLNHTVDVVKEVEEFDDVPLYPTILSAVINRGRLVVKIEERNGGIGRVSFSINHKERESNINVNGETEFSLPLNKYEKFYAKGENTISIRCWNEEGWLPGPYHELTYENKKRTKEISTTGALHTLFVGTSEYRNPSLTLSFPDKDATYLNDAIKIVGRHLFENNMHTKLLTTKKPASEHFSSKENIQKAFEELAEKAKPQDVVIIYFSGHGANYDDGKKAQYYYLTHEILSSKLNDSAVRQKGTISSDELTEWVNNIAAQKQVLIFDTCYSGKIVDSLKSKNAVDSTRDRAMERMKDRTGMYVLTGSAADKVSYEASNYGQGLLTYTLLQGMKGAALLQRTSQPEKSVDVMTLFSYSREEVERLSNEFSVTQRPTLRAPLNVESFDIGIAPESARRQIKVASPKPIFVRSNFMNSKNFIDDLNISETLDQYLTGSIGIGNRPQAIFIDIVNYDGAHSVSGIYNKNSEGYLLKGKVYIDEDSIGDFEVRGKGMEDIIPKIARRVEEIAFPKDEYEIPSEDEYDILEKGRKQDLEALVGQPGYGYDESFIGNNFSVPVPVLSASQKKDIAKSTKGEELLHYQYYSVIQSKKRKFPFFAACNLNGGEFRQLGRSGSFIRDPRLPKEFHWDDDFYKFEFKDKQNNVIKYTKIFDRGHMTKREDTQWGKTDEIAEQGAKLTFFFTNALPQHGHLNGVIWRGLEDYIMDVASGGKKAVGDEGYKINILTGPVFQDDDPKLPIEVKGEKDEVPVPVLFWKVVYFKKKSENKLYYIGFMMGQKTLLEEAFGNFGIAARAKEAEAEDAPFLSYKDKEVFQVKISFIEEKTNMKFHKAIDPMKDSKDGMQISEVIKKPKSKDAASESDELTYSLDGLMM